MMELEERDLDEAVEVAVRRRMRTMAMDVAIVGRGGENGRLS